jgi:hypothetical protein
MSPAIRELIELLARAAYEDLASQADQSPAGADPREQVTESRAPS